MASENRQDMEVRMTVLKAVVRGIGIAIVSVSSAQAGTMLFLGVSSGTGPAPQGSPAVASSSASLPVYSGSASGLQLGVTSSTDALVFQAGMTPTSNFSPSTAVPSTISTPSPSSQGVALPSFSTSSPQPSTPPTYDAFINVGSGPYPGAGGLTTGNAQPWFLSSPVEHLFGGVPTIQQRTDFDSAVLQRVQQTFNLSGVPVSLTEDPNATAAHTISVVSQTTNPSLSGAIGMTYLGGNGFHYIDNSASAAQSVDQLEWIVAHNISHELMLAFNVPEKFDQTGQYVDARTASWSMITNPTSTFSPAAVNALLAQNFSSNGGSILSPGAQLLEPSSVPEPSTVVLWVAIAGVGLVVKKARKRA
jgi:hypothetical protein